MPVSVFGTMLGQGLDTLLETLVRRDLMKRQKEEAERRDRLDKENQRRFDIQVSNDERDYQQRLVDKATARLDKQAAVKSKELEEEGFRNRQADFINALDPNVRIAAFESMQGRDIGIDPKALARPKSAEEIAAEQKAHLEAIKNEARARAEGQRLGAPPLGRSGGGPSKATPNQIMTAGRNALRDAQVEERNGMLPPGMTVQERAVELRTQYLTDLGVDVPEPKAPPIPSTGRQVGGIVVPSWMGENDPAIAHLQRRSGGAGVLAAPAAPPAAPAGGGQPVQMVAPDGRTLMVPAADVQRMLSLGAKLAQ